MAKKEKTILEEYKDILKDLGVVNLELKEEQRILPLLKKLNKVIKRYAKVPDVKKRTGSADMNKILEDMSKLIKLLGQDKRLDLIIIKEDRKELKDAHEFRISRKRKQAERNFEKKHIFLLKKIINLFGNIKDETRKIINNLIMQETSNYFRQLKELLFKEMRVFGIEE